MGKPAGTRRPTAAVILWMGILFGLLMLGGCERSSSDSRRDGSDAVAPAGAQAPRDKSAGSPVAGAPAANVPLAETLRRLASWEESLAALPHFDVSGRVTNLSGDAIEGAEVFLCFSDGRNGARDRLAGKTQTGSGGAFRFEKAVVWPLMMEERWDGAPKYVLLARHPDLGMYFRVLLEGDPTEGVQVVLHPYRSYKDNPEGSAITVQDSNGNPVPGANVYLCGGALARPELGQLDAHRAFFRFYRNVGILSYRTDQNGQVLVRENGCLDGMRLQMENVNHAGASCLFPGSTYRLSPPSRVEGKVTAPDGSPVAGVEVALFDYMYEKWSCTTTTTQTGVFRFENVCRVNPYRQDAQPPDLFRSSNWVTLQAEDTRWGSPLLLRKKEFSLNPGQGVVKDLPMQPGCLLSGRIVDAETSKPLAGIRMKLTYDSMDGPAKVFTSDESGWVRAAVKRGSLCGFLCLPSARGDYLMHPDWLAEKLAQARKKEPSPYVETLFQRKRISHDESDHVFPIKLCPIRPVAGCVLDDAGTSVSWARILAGSGGQEILSDERGRFLLKCAPADLEFDLIAFSPDKTKSGSFRLKPGIRFATIRLLPGKDYRGQALDMEGGPAPNLYFSFVPLWAGRPVNGLSQWCKADAKGSFEVKNAFPGLQYRAEWQDTQIEEGKPSQEVYDMGKAELDLNAVPEGGSVSFQVKAFPITIVGRVVTPEGNPIEGANVHMDRQASRSLPVHRYSTGWRKTDKNGWFTIPGLGAGKVPLIVDAKGFMSVKGDVPTDWDGLKVVLKPFPPDGFAYRFRVTDTEGRALPRVPVSLWIQDSDSWKREWKSWPATTDEKGTAVIRWNPGPSIRIWRRRGIFTCDLKGYDPCFWEILLEEDFDTAIVLRKKGIPLRGRVVNSRRSPVAGATIEVFTCYPWNWQRKNLSGLVAPVHIYTYSTGRDGRFNLDPFTRGNGVSFSIQADGYADTYGGFEKGHDGSEKEFILADGGNLSGKVRMKSGEPLPPGPLGVSVRPIAWGGPNSNYVKTAPDGAFQIKGIQPGPYTVYCSPSRDDLPTTETKRSDLFTDERLFPVVEIEAGKTKEVMIDLAMGYLVQGRIADAATGGIPEGKINIFVWGEEGFVKSQDADEKGQWSMYLPEGDYEIRAQGGATYSHKLVRKDLHVSRDAPPAQVLQEMAR